MNLETAIREKVHFLSSEQQKKVLNFIETLPKKKLRFLQSGILSQIISQSANELVVGADIAALNAVQLNFMIRPPRKDKKVWFSVPIYDSVQNIIYAGGQNRERASIRAKGCVS